MKLTGKTLGCVAKLIFLLLVSTAAHSKTLESSVYEALKVKRPDLHWKFESAENAIHVENAIVALDNVKKEISSRGLKGERAISFAVSAIAPNLDLIISSQAKELRWETVSDRVLPAIAPAEYGNTLMCRGVSRLVSACFVIDYPNGRAYITREQFGHLGISSDELERVAMINLQGLAGSKKVTVSAGAPGKIQYVFFDGRDTYDATRILLPNLPAMLAGLFEGKAFVAIPNRDFLIAWPAGKFEHLKFVRQIDNDYRSRSYPLTNELFVVDEHGVRLATDAEKTSGIISSQ